MSPVSVSETIFHLYTIENPNWSQANENQKEAIANAIIEGGWYIVSGLRRGFLNCNIKEDIIYGYFAEEGKLRIEQFDDYQQPTVDEEKSFERILFLFFMDAGILAVQSIRISRYLDLTGPSVRQSFFTALEVLFRTHGFSFRGQSKFEKYRTDLTRDQLLQIFSENQISRVVNTFANYGSAEG